MSMSKSIQENRDKFSAILIHKNVATVLDKLKNATGKTKRELIEVAVLNMVNKHELKGEEADKFREFAEAREKYRKAKEKMS